MFKRQEPVKVFLTAIPGCGAEAVVRVLKAQEPGLTCEQVNADPDPKTLRRVENADLVFGDLTLAEVERVFPDRAKAIFFRNPLARALDMLPGVTTPSGASGGPMPAALLAQLTATYDSVVLRIAPNSHKLSDSSEGGDLQPSSLLHSFRFVGLIEQFDDDVAALRALITGHEKKLGASCPSQLMLQASMAQINQLLSLNCKGLSTDRALYCAAQQARAARRFSTTINVGARPRVAIASPMPPAEFGVAVYSGETAIALSKYADVTAVSESSLPFSISRHLVDMVDARSCKDLNGYDAAFFVYGNHHHHLHMSRIALETDRGIGIFHDAQQLDFCRFALGDNRTREIASSAIGRVVSQKELERWQAFRHWLEDPMLEPVGGLPHSVVVHSPLQQAFHAARYPGASVNYVPVAIQHRYDLAQLDSSARSRAKLRVGIHERDLNIGTFGFVHNEKQADTCISAMRHLHDRGIQPHLWFVGDIRDDVKRSLLEVISLLELEGYVHFSGRITEQQYLDYLLAMDVGVQLRRPLFGQLSGALLDCVSAALTTISNRTLADAIEAPPYVHRIKDDFTSLTVALEIERVLSLSDPLAKRLALWGPYSEAHSFDSYARHLISLV